MILTQISSWVYKGSLIVWQQPSIKMGFGWFWPTSLVGYTKFSHCVRPSYRSYNFVTCSMIPCFFSKLQNHRSWLVHTKRKIVHFKTPSFNNIIICWTSFDWCFCNLEKWNLSKIILQNQAIIFSCKTLWDHFNFDITYVSIMAQEYAYSLTIGNSAKTINKEPQNK